MTATDELRRLLDERGVEWNATVGAAGTNWTHWDTFNGHRVHAMDNEDGTVKIFGGWDVTPEQAIAATLGAGTCHMEYCDELSGDELYPTQAYVCSACMYVTVDGKPNYCPQCGAKVVDG